MNEGPAVSTEALTRRFGEHVAVDRLTLSVKSGELFGLVGPDGAGKTTTLRMLAGVLPPTDGQAYLNGISVVTEPERVKHHIAYMSQRFGLYADLTVRENLLFYADLYQVPRQQRQARLERLYAFSNLKPFSDRLAGRLSGGMKQKLGLSCALIHQPDILLLDEPTFGVDPVSRRDLWLIVHEMVALGVTVVVSTAYMDEAERFDRVALLQHGTVLAQGTPDELRAGFQGEILAARVHPLRPAYELLRSHPAVHRATVFGEQLHLTVDSAARRQPAIESSLRAADIDLLACERVSPTMEDAFIGRVLAVEAE